MWDLTITEFQEKEGFESKFIFHKSIMLWFCPSLEQLVAAQMKGHNIIL